MRICHLDDIRDTTVFGCFPEFEPFLDREHVRTATDRLALMDGAQADRFVDRVPAEWQVDAPVREAWGRFIAQRAAFVAANMTSWLWA